MCGRSWRSRWTGLLCLAIALGCSPRTTEPPAATQAANEEGPVREKFAELQSAIKSQDTEKLWALLDARSRSDAERTAKDMQAAYKQASSEKKAKQEETLGLSGKELADLTGQGVLKTKRFQKKHHEIPDGVIDRVAIQGDSATLYYHEPDGDNEKAIFVRQDGQWKAWLTMPKVNKP
jgi:hypothetical protein